MRHRIDTANIALLAATILLALNAIADNAHAFSAERIGHTVADKTFGNTGCRNYRHDIHAGWLIADNEQMVAWYDGRPCTITWSRAWLDLMAQADTPEARRVARIAICSIYVHEVGHIAGYSHDHTGHGNIMRNLNQYPPCVRAVDWADAYQTWKAQR